MLSPAVSKGASRPDIDTAALRESLQVLSQQLSFNEGTRLSEILDGRINAAHHIRQSLVSGPQVVQAQDAFRFNQGYESIVDTLSSLSSFLAHASPDSEDYSAYAEFFHACVTVLSASLCGHYGNRRYFTSRIPKGGWKRLESACQPWIETSSPSNPSVLNKLLGSLLVCALNDDSNYSLFGDCRRALEDIPDENCTPTGAKTNDDAMSPLTTRQVSFLDQALEQGVQPSAFLHNPEALLPIFHLWQRLSENHGCRAGELLSTVALVPRLLERIAGISFHNLLALHRSELFAGLLLYLSQFRTGKEAPEFLRLFQRLLNLGVPRQEHARQLYRGARGSSIISELLLNCLESASSPPFIHFDLSLHGYASVELTNMGAFPPMGKSAGYTLALWLNVMTFDADAHTTIFGALDSSHTCFLLLYIERRTRNIILQTSSSSSSRPSVRFKSFSFQSGLWYHVALVHERPRSIASSRASLYINGEFVEQVKSHYPLTPAVNASSLRNKEASGTHETAVVQAFLGTPQDLATNLRPGVTKLQWRIASAHLLSDTLGDDLIAVLYRLGPRYIGNYQDCLGSFQTYEASAALNLRNENLHYGREEKSDIVVAIRQKASLILPEDSVILNFSPVNMLYKIGDPWQDDQALLVDGLSKLSAKVFRSALRDGRHSILVNGAIPSIDAALRRHRGIAVLNGDPAPVVPQMLDDSAWRLGGCSSVVLSLFAAAHDPEELQRSLRIICTSVRYSWRNSEAMERDNGFGVLANLLSEKVLAIEQKYVGAPTDPEELLGGRELFDGFCVDILRILLEFVGHRLAHPESSIINNPLAYRILLVDINIWRSLGLPVQKLYYQQFLDFGLQSKYRRFNVKRLTRMRIAKRWLEALKAETFREDTVSYFLATFKFVLSAALTPDTMRATALCITFGLCTERWTSTRSAGSKSSQGHNASRARGQSLRTDESGAVFKRSFEMPYLSRRQLASRVLAMFAEILCLPRDIGSIKKFAKAVTNKWLLYLVDDDDPQIVSIAVKLISRLLVVNGVSYADKFSGKTGGFDIMRHHLGRFWSHEKLWWSCFSILFGKDVAEVDNARKLDLYALIDTFGADKKDIIAFPDVLPVLMAMLRLGLEASTLKPIGGENTLVEEPSDEQKSSSNKNSASTISQSESGQEKSVMLHNILRFLADLHGKSQSFRDFAATSLYVQELLHVLFPVVADSQGMSAEAELHSREIPQVMNNRSNLVRPLYSFSNGTHVIRAASAESPVDDKPKRAPASRRMSSYVLLSSEWRHTKRTAGAVVELGAHSFPRRKSLLVEELLEIATAVFSDQLLYRKDFLGLGLFMKVPPGVQEDQAFFETFILRNTITHIGNTIQLNLRLLWEPRVLTNLSRFTAHLREATFEGWFIDGSETILDFLGGILEYLQLPEIHSLKSVRLCNQTIVAMTTNLIRTILLRLSELGSAGPHTQLVRFMEKLISWQAVLWSKDMSNDELFHHFCFLLYQQLQHEQHAVKMIAANSWRMLMVQRPKAMAAMFRDATTNSMPEILEGFNKLMELDNETFLCWVEEHVAELCEVFAPLSIGWLSFVNEENRNTTDSLTLRITKRRERLKQWQAQSLAIEDVQLRHDYSARLWQSNICSSELIKSHRTAQDQQDNHIFNASTWNKMSKELRRPCALYEDSEEQVWHLDPTEGRNRMRLRLIPDENDEGLEIGPKRKQASDLARKRSIVSMGSKSRNEKNASRARSSSESTSLSSTENVSDDVLNLAQGDTEDSAHQDESFEMINAFDDDPEGYEDKNRKVMRSLQRGDQVDHIHNVSRIVGLEACEGLLIQGKSHLYLIDHLLQRSDGEIVNVCQAPEEERDPYVQLISGRDEARHDKPPYSSPHFETRSWSWDEILSISKRRFLFRDVAIEVFFVDGQSYLLICKTYELRDIMYQKLHARVSNAAETTNADSTEDSWRSEALRNPEDRSQTLGSKFSGVFAQNLSSPATRKWGKGEISNFHYLMLVNTMAGRTFNDLTQYPVFPWVIADYTSNELDLSNPRTFRDLTKPMGCQNAEREEEFRDRYRSFAEMGDDTSTAFHYGTHYSSAMIVTSYLIRLRPYTQSYLLLQGGSFDYPDRLFYDIGKTWSSASRDNMTDVRELIPEFFCLPEFLVNSNRFDFGNRQSDGGPVDSVVLPPWAKGDPKIFVAKQREALESDYVSKHLHHWIDLVFGHKQRGEAAVEATNVFHHLSYHGARDLDAITNKSERLATIGIIHNFGQTPHQVFQRSHPPREDSKSEVKELESNAENLTRLPFPLLDIEEKVCHMTRARKDDRLFCSGAFRIHLPPFFDKYLEWGFVDGSLRFYTSDSKKLIGLSEHVHQTQVSCVLVLDSKTLVTAGADSTIGIWTMLTSTKTVTLVPKTYFFGHDTAINALAASRAFATLLSASFDGQIMLWDLNRLKLVRKLKKSDRVECARINDVTGDILVCHERIMVLYTLNGEYIAERNACNPSSEDAILSCAFYEGAGNRHLARQLIFTGHKRGVANVWHKVIRDGGFRMEHIKTLNHFDQSGSNISSAILSILPTAKMVYTGDDDGRVYEWDCIPRQ